MIHFLYAVLAFGYNEFFGAICFAPIQEIEVKNIKWSLGAYTYMRGSSKVFCPLIEANPCLGETTYIGLISNNK